MKYEIVYIVIREGEIEFASVDEELAEGYADNQGFIARQEVLEEWGNDDPSEEDIAEADFQAGFNGDYYEVVEVDISNKTENDTIELPNGDKIEVFYILKKLREEMDYEEDFGMTF